MLVLSYDGNDLVEATHLTIVRVENGYSIVDRAHSKQDGTPLYVSKVYATLADAKTFLKDYAWNQRTLFFVNQTN